MSLKNLFTQKVISTNTVENVEKNIVESKNYISEYTTQKDKFVPKIDFSTASNFVSFGSAEEYYRQSIARIYDTYPYDGSKSEKLKWHNESSYLDQYIFDVRYPKSTGYVSFSPSGWGISSSAAVGGYGNPTVKEYITVKGGPNTGSEALESKPLSSLFDLSNKWDSTLNRTSNLGFDLSNSGSTIEFWLKKPAFITGSTQKEVILDIWNNNASSSADYGRLTLELTGASNPFLLTVQSGTSGVFRANISSLTTSSLENWHHYAISMINSSSQLQVKFYVDGVLQTTTLTGSSINQVNGALVGNIGALYTAPSGTTGISIGWGKLSGSIDEFRFWKMKRTSEHIGHYWWTSVDGGTNTDDYSTNLGVYYKFNEGILGTSSTDSLVLDYSGRVSNGVWTGYTTTSRNSGSAINEYFNDTTKEVGDPIIYSTHSLVSDLQTELINSGSEHDYNNSSYLYHTLPSWIIEEDEVNGSTAKKLFQIISSYFDTVSLQIKELNKIKDYYSDLNDESKPYSFSNQLLEGNGLITPDLFIDATIFEQLLNRDEYRNFDEKLYDLKNHIYQNIYNSLIAIYKSKGTEKAYRNFLHSYGIDEKLVKINLYANNAQFDLEDSVKTIYKKKKLLDLNHPDRFEATVYQNQNSATDWSYISGSNASDKEAYLGFTVEANVVIPKVVETSDAFRNANFATSSLFGVHTALSTSQVDLTWDSPDDCNFQVSFIKLNTNPTYGYFQLSSSNPFPIPCLTSSIFYDVYNNSNWIFSVRLKNDIHPYAGFTTGSSNEDYTLEFAGSHILGNRVLESFNLTSSISNAVASSFLSANKRFYIGAERTNFTGSVINYTDIKFADFKVWLNHLSDTELLSHGRDIDSVGVENPYTNYSFYNNQVTNTEIPAIQSLILHWDFENVTSSDAGSGNPLLNDATFGVTDLAYNSSATSGSRYESWFEDIKYKNYPGKGNFVLPNKTNIIDIDYITQDKIVDPELINSSDTVNVLSSEQIVFGKTTKPTEFRVLFEKSMYQVISEQMLNMFSNVLTFNELIGNVYNKYRHQYKELNHLRQLFYEKVQNEPDLDKFIEFYKWFDSSLGIFLNQITPVSAQVDEKLHVVVEETVLKRNKIKHQFPTLEFKSPDLEAGAEAINKLLYDWRLGSRPLSGAESDHAFWWRERAERALLPPTASVLTSRSLILSASTSALTRKYTTPIKQTFDTTKFYSGGTNYYPNANINFLDIAVSPHGPIDSDATSSIPANYLLAGVVNTSSLLKDIDDVTQPNKKVKYHFPVVHGRDYLSSSLALNEKLKSNIALPVNFVSGNLTSGYHADVNSNFMSGVVITNIHNDVYGPHKESSVQGPFTNQWVGGRQSRHVSINRGTDNYTTRPEAWKLLLGTGSIASTEFQTAVGFVGADYPYPEGNPSEPSFPVLIHKRATYYREETAKRPVNIRNIITSTSSVEIGNYTEPYEVFMVSGRTSNNRLLKRAYQEGSIIGDYNLTELSGVLRNLSYSNSGRVDNTLPERSGSSNILGNRFSAPGGPRYSSRGFLNKYAEELSAYNAMPFRNREIIGNSHGTGLPYDAYAVSGATGTGSMDMFARPSARTGYVSGSSTVASIHKENRNPSYHVKSEQFTAKFDNAYVTTQIPRKDTGYSWINSSIPNVATASKDIWEHYRHANGNEFITSNTITSSYIGYRIGSVSGAVESYSAPQDFVGLNTIIVEPINPTGTNTVGTSSLNSITSSFITTVPTSSNLFNAMIVHRNGGYGFPSFKQLASRRNDKISQYLRNNNLIQNLDVNGDIQTYSEPAIDDSNHPIVIEAYVDENPITVSSSLYDIKFTYDNNISKFSNFDLNRDLNLQNSTKEEVENSLRRLIIKDNLDGFYYEPRKITYKKRIFPISSVPQRKRTSFVHEYWRDSQADRTITNYEFTNMNLLAASIWPLDSRINYTQTSATYSDAAVSSSTEGLLQNLYTLRTGSAYATYGLPLYFYKQSVSSTGSVRSPSGLKYTTLPIPTASYITTGTLFFNSTKWQVYDDTGFKPYDDNYETWLGDMHKQRKSYSVLPEYRISTKIPTLVSNGFSISSLDENYLEVTGASLYASTSSNDLAGASYIERTLDSYSSDYNPPKITFTLTCKTVEKFLPYNGFYPVERTLDLVSAFSSSYVNYVSLLSGSGLGTLISKTDSKFTQHYRTMIQPLFAPGILYNTIKSGIAVDYPIITSSLQITQSNYDSTAGRPKDTQISNNTFDLRLPFETILDPEKYLYGISMVDMNPSEYTRLNSTASLNGSGDKNYKLMVNNFLAETVNLFLKNRTPSSIRSNPISSVKAESGNRYQALVKIYKSTGNSTKPLVDNNPTPTQDYPRPQYDSSSIESITMFSNPLGFGPPCSSGTGSSGYSIGTKDSTNGYNAPFTPPYYDGESWAIIEFAPNASRTYTIDEIIGSSSVKYIRYEFDVNSGIYDSTYGAIGPQGSAYMNQNAMQVSASLNLFNLVDYNELTPTFNPNGGIASLTADKTRSKKMWEISSKFETPILNFSPTATGRNVTQPTSSGNDWGLANAGMWLQYGEIPEADQGIYMQITDVPRSYKRYGTYGASGSITNSGFYYNDANSIAIDSIKSLVDLVGFSTEPVKMGELADNRIFKEAIVAIPYTISDTNERQFVKLNKRAVQKLLFGELNTGNATPASLASTLQSTINSGLATTNTASFAQRVDYTGTFVEEQLRKLQDYVLPLHLDFINNPEIDPIAMYVFEIQKTVTQSDLSNIWQNVMPQDLNKVQNNEYTLTHTIEDKEMLSSLNVRPGETVKFMCFKVKQRGISKYEFSNYDDEKANNISVDNKRMLKQSIRNKKKISAVAQEIDSQLDKGIIGYNWPYDYFSLVELAEIDAVVEFSQFNPDPVNVDPTPVEEDSAADSIDFSTGSDSRNRIDG